MSDWYVTFNARSISWMSSARWRSSSAERGATTSGFVAPGSGEYQRSYPAAIARAGTSNAGSASKSLMRRPSR